MTAVTWVDVLATDWHRVASTALWVCVWIGFLWAVYVWNGRRNADGAGATDSDAAKARNLDERQDR